MAVGPTISVRIGFDPSFLPFDERPPDLPERRVPAVIDTGAVISCIDSAVTASLGLPVAELASVAGVHGPGIAEVYLAQMSVPDLGAVLRGRFHAAHLGAGGHHRAILGRTFLQHYAMTYDGRTGAVRLVGDPP